MHFIHHFWEALYKYTVIFSFQENERAEHCNTAWGNVRWNCKRMSESINTFFLISQTEFFHGENDEHLKRAVTAADDCSAFACPEVSVMFSLQESAKRSLAWIRQLSGTAVMNTFLSKAVPSIKWNRYIWCKNGFDDRPAACNGGVRCGGLKPSTAIY